MLPVQSLTSSAAAFAFVLLLPLSRPVPAQQPVDAPFQNGFNQPVGFAFHGADRLYVCERRGVVRVVDHGVPLPAPLIDISEEVGSWRDFGLLGFALDPAFASNGHFYLSYVVDRHHLLHFGTPSYNASAEEFFAATIARVTRYTADPASGFTTTVPGSRHILLGETPQTGAPIVHESHGACQLLFGRDGTLLVAIGDGAHFHLLGDFGHDPLTYDQQAVNDGILRPEENVGVWRAQMLSSLSGKILRLDPATGDGVPSNPFFDPTSPRSARSRTYALGFRNPFRMSLRPGTGSVDPTLGRPGVIYLGDVGWYTREELDVVTAPGQNFGWPLFEGIDPCPLYQATLVANPDAPNPLAGTNGCNVPFFRFQDLLHQADADHTAFHPNPCDPTVAIAIATPTFEHTLPVLDWHHSWQDVRVPLFENGVLVTRLLGTPASQVPGPQFHGGCSVGGCWHSGLSFPASFGPCYYHADYGVGWIRRFEFDAQDHLLAVHDVTSTFYPVMLGEHPGDHSLIYLGMTGDQMRAIRYGVDPAPTARPTADLTFGRGGLEVQLDARDSSDPEGQPLSYRWDLGNGRISTAPQFGYRFRGIGSPTLQQVQLTVTDPAGGTDTATLPIAIDNSPPRVAITSFGNGDLYSLASPTVLPLIADVADDEHGAQQLTWSWRTALHHDSHVHPEPADSQPTTTTVLSPTPTGGEFFAYSVDLTVTDAGGLSTSVRQWLFPDTSSASTSVLLTSPTSGERFAPGVAVQFSALTSGNVQRVDYFVEGELVGVGTAPPYACLWTPTTGGTLVAIALAVASDGSSSNSRGLPFAIEVPQVTKARVASSSGDAVEAIGQAAAPVTTATALVLGDDGTLWRTGLSFAVPTIPVGARIQSAWIEFTAAQADGGKAHFDIACDLHPTPRAIGQRPKDLQGRLTGAPIAWSPGPWQAAESSAAQRTPDLASLIQPLVADMKWRQQLLFLLRGAGERRAVAWDGDRLVAPLLTISWLPPMPSHGDIAVDTDAIEDSGGAVDVDGPVLPLGVELGAPRLAAMQFALALPQGARIDSAHVQFTTAGHDLGGAVLTIRAEAADDAAPLAPSPFDLSTRLAGPGIATWYPPEWPTAGACDADQRTPELRDLLQTILDRPGWQSGNKVVLLVHGTGSRTAASLDAGPAGAPVLHLGYRLP